MGDLAVRWIGGAVAYLAAGVVFAPLWAREWNAAHAEPHRFTAAERGALALSWPLLAALLAFVYACAAAYRLVELVGRLSAWIFPDGEGR
jgi:hypothetical protein